MVGWTSLSLVANDEDAQRRMLSILSSVYDEYPSSLQERDGVEFVHIYVPGYEAQRDGDDLAGDVLGYLVEYWDYGARIDANNTTDSGDGWYIETDGPYVSYVERFDGVECAQAHDVADQLAGFVDFLPPVRRV